MPLLHVGVHLLLTAACVLATLRLNAKSAAAWVLGVGGLAVVIAGFAVERRYDLAWSAMAGGWPDAVFYTNLSLEGVAVLVTLLWRSARDRPARLRAAALSAFSVGAALWSLKWYFGPAPADLTGFVNSAGYCRQTSEQSCGAAAAATLLFQHGIRTTEAEMGQLCLTRAGFGTTPLGILRGVAVRGREHGLHARLATVKPEGDLARLPTPAIISVGLHGDAPPDVAQEMEGYGWTPGLHHALVVLSVDPKGRTLKVADPSYGQETWPEKGLRWIWDGRALYLTR
jgi:predicted double-glycine peptidase